MGMKQTLKQNKIKLSKQQKVIIKTPHFNEKIAEVEQ